MADVVDAYIESLTRDIHELQEKNTRLEQVAREMYTALVWCCNGCFKDCPMLHDGCMVADDRLKERIEELGVSVDD